MNSVVLTHHRCAEDEQQRRRRNRVKSVVVAGVVLFAIATRHDEVPPPPPPPPPAPKPQIVTETKVVTLLQTFEPFGPPPPSRLLVTPDGIGVAAHRVGTGSEAIMVSVANDGAYPLAARVSLRGDEGFAITNGCTSTLPGNSQCAIAVVFQPRRAGMHRATLTVGTKHVSLTGIGVEERVIVDKLPPPPPPPPPPRPLTLKPAIVDPESIVFHSAGRERATITNPNDAPLRITDIAIIGGTSDGYKIPDRERCLTTLPPRGRCEITILALPRAVSRRQTIRIHVSSE